MGGLARWLQLRMQSRAIEDQPAWSIEYLVLQVLIVGLLREIIAAMRLENLPVVQPSQQYQHSESHQQENEHLSPPRPLHFAIHALASFLPGTCRYLR